MKRIVENVACTVCGDVCDDLRIHIDGDQIVEAEHACVLAHPWFLAQDCIRPPTASIRRKPAPFQNAVDEAVAILSQSRAPLIYGLSRSTTEGQRVAVALADKIGATIDTTASMDHAPSILAFQEVGESTCSLGEVKTRADLVIFWGCDPNVTHPRHLERFLDGRPSMGATSVDRERIFVDTVPPTSLRSQDWFIPIGPGRHFESLWVLRCMILGKQLDLSSIPELALPELTRLADRMKKCTYGVVFFGLGLSQVAFGNRNVEALLRLVSELNRFQRFSARRLRMQGDVAGADSVLCWQTGYPFSVNLARGYPRYNPDEFSAEQMLARHEVDALLLVGSEYESRFSQSARDYLRTIPTVVLDSPTVTTEFEPTVQFTTAVYGVHRPGTAYRMDEIPIPLQVLLPTPYPTDAEVLDAIRRAL